MSKQIDERDRRIGRAFVDDDEKLQAYYRELERHESGALWTVANDIEPWEPVAHSVPMIWRHADLREPVLRSLDLVSPRELQASGLRLSGSPNMLDSHPAHHSTRALRASRSWRATRE